jgi:predicted extracellular nuclease
VPSYLVVLVALATAIGGMACRDLPPDVSPDAEVGTRVRLATFNVRRFFDTVCDSGACGPDDYEVLPSPDAFAARADQLAAAIAGLDADVIALEEVETQACLDALLARLGDVMPNGVLGEIGSAASVDVAVLSKTAIDEVVRHRAAHPLALPSGAVTTFSRELLEVHTRAANGAEVVLFAAHFKSKSNDQPDRRLAEAQVSSEIVNAVASARPGVLVVLGGDLNDTPGSPPLNALTVDGGLVRVADDLPIAGQGTYTYGSSSQAIDHLLLAPGVAAMRVPRSSRVWRDGRGWGGSDHAALTSEFLVP